HRAPHGESNRLRRPLSGMEGAAHAGMDAVAPHEHLALDTGIPGELGPDASLLLPEVHQLMAGMHAARAEPREDCAMENAQQLAPVDRELWPAVTRGEAARLGPD